jgi:HSP20 family protein
MANLIRRDNREGARATGAEYGLDPFRVMDALLRWDPLRGGEWSSVAAAPTFVPRFDVMETKDAYVLKADMPGVKEEQLDVSLNGNLLTISGKREADHHDDGDAYFAIERSYGSFARSFTMPESVDGAGVTADLKNGVLTVRIPKKPEAQPRRIAIGNGAQTKAKA